MSSISNEIIEKSIKTLSKTLQINTMAIERSIETLKTILEERKEVTAENTVKTERSDEDEEEVAKDETAPKKARKAPEPDPDFVCPGQIWMEPVEACVGGDTAHLQQGIRYNNKLRKICKGCKRLYDNKKKRENNQKKKEAAVAKE